MAVPMQHGLARKLGIGNRGAFFKKKLAKKIGLPIQPFGNFVAGKKINQFVAEHGNASGLEADDGYAVVDSCCISVEYLAQLLLCLIQHAEIVKRPPAADVLAGTRT